MEIKKVLIPDIGDFKDVPIVEVLVTIGDKIKYEDPLLTLESDKATIEIPAPFSGVIKEINVKPNDKVSAGTQILLVEVADAENKGATTTDKPIVSTPIEATTITTDSVTTQQNPQLLADDAILSNTVLSKPHAGPAVRRFARELGVDLSLLTGSGPKQRILKQDVQAYVKTKLLKSQGDPDIAGPFDLLPWPQIDFAKFGPIELKPLSRIKQITGKNLHRNWVMIPHVTQFDEADITDLETLRKKTNQSVKKDNIKLTLLAFLMKGLLTTLKKFPEFNASLNDDNGVTNLVIKHYYHIGFAVDTPNGLMVPVVKDVDQKGVIAIAKELNNLSISARDGKLKPSDMQGAGFTISSLGGIGGTAFTPIINAPEVAILGVSRASMKPVYVDNQFVPRLMLPLSLSYDHRVIDGASAARFTVYLASVLTDMRLALL